MGIFLISDPHFDHHNIIEYCRRPFNGVDEMNEALINNWNEVVAEKDLVWLLGDVSLGNTERTLSFMHRLNGQKNLIIGNHDRKRSKKFWHRAGFAQVYKDPCEIKTENGLYVLSHEKIWREYLKENQLNIHGHSHFSLVPRKDNYWNVCVENIDYKPVEVVL